MKSQIKHFSDLTLEELYAILKLRGDVFYLEQRVTATDADGIDQKCLHLFIIEQQQAVAYLRIIPPTVLYAESSIGRVATASTHRHRGLCEALLREAIAIIAERWGNVGIRISAQSYLLGLYSKLGFEVASEEYMEAGIPHIKMAKRN